jgi:hypothetical protein
LWLGFLMMLFALAAFSQATCANPTSNAVFLRAEGTAEQVAQLTFVCTNSSGTALAAGSGSVQVFFSPALPITSKLLSSVTAATEATVTVNGSGQTQGIVSGTSITFSNIPLPALATFATYTFVVSNVRVNASSLIVGPGVPPAVSETVFVNGTAGNIVPQALAATTVAFVQNGLGGTALYKDLPSNTAGSNNFQVCQGYSPNTGSIGAGLIASRAFTVRVNETFVSAFKDVAAEASWVSAAIAASGNAVVDGTRLVVNFTNVPNGVALYVPATAIRSRSGGPASIQLTASTPDVAFAAIAPSIDPAVNGNGLAPVSLNAGAGAAIFEVVTSDLNSLDGYDIPVYIVTTANGATASATPVGVSVSFAPIGSAAIPNFVVSASTVTLSGSTFNGCAQPPLSVVATPGTFGFGNSSALSITGGAGSGAVTYAVNAGTANCSVTGAILSAASVGACTVTATRAADSTYLSATSPPFTITVTQASQTITFAPLSNVFMGSGPVTLTATASSALLVSFVSNSPAVCTVLGSTVTLVSAGTCSITASQGGNANYSAAASVGQSFQVSQVSQTITFAPLSDAALGSGPAVLVASATSGLPVSFSSTTPAVCNSTGTLLSAGTCSITASQAGNATYSAAASITRSFNITANPNPGFSITELSPYCPQFAGTNVDPSVYGRVTTIQPGEFLSIYGTGLAGTTASSNGASPTSLGGVNVTINGKAAYLWNVSPTRIDLQAPSDAATGKVALNVINGALTLSSSVNLAGASPSFCLIDATHVSGTIVRSDGSGAYGSGGYDIIGPLGQFPFSTKPVKPGDIVNLITAGLGPTSPAVPAGSAYTGAAATINPVQLSINGTGIHPDFAGLVAQGFYQITFVLPSSLGGGDLPIQLTVGGVQTAAGFVIPVQNSAGTPQSITFGPLSNLAFGASPFALTATASSALPVTYISTTPLICTVSGKTVTILAGGTCSITASQSGSGAFNAATPVTQSFTVTPAAQTITFGPLSNVVLGSGAVTLTATASTGLPVTFASTTQAVCTVSVATVTLVSAGTCSITASQAGTANYAAAAPVTQTFNVTAAAQTITFAPLSNAALGSGPFALTAAASSGLAVSFASSTLPVCSVSGNVLTLLTTGTCSVTASQQGNANYSAAASVTQSFTVAPAGQPQTITFGALPNVTMSPNPIVLTATASSGLAVSFASATPATCSVTANSLALLGVGACSVSATQAGNGTYAAAPAVTQSFTISVGTQSITFGPLSNAVFGSGTVTVSAAASSGLPVIFASTTQAVCTITGNTVTLLAAGTCSIVALQAGNANYSPATPVTQPFSVTRATQTITFGPLSDAAFGSGPVSLSATATSGLAVVYTPNTGSVCGIVGSAVTLLAQGLCSITASQPGNANFLAAPPVTQTFNVTPGPTISFNSVPAWGQTGPVTGTVSLPAGWTTQVWVYLFQFIPDVGWQNPNGCGPTASLASSGAFSAASPSSLYSSATRVTAFVTTSAGFCLQSTAAIPSSVIQNSIASATLPRLAGYQTLNFGGLEWFIKAPPTQVSPNGNFFSASNAFVDPQGQLHLKVTPCGSGWCSAEIFTRQNVGYGAYSFSVASPLNNLDPNVTLGMFTWDAQDAADSNREWDIEVSRWGNASASTNAQFVVQPYNGPGNIQHFLISSGGGTLHTVTWNPTSVTFSTASQGTAISSWSYQQQTPQYPVVPTPGDARLHLNLYIASGSQPATLTSQEVILSQFQYTPAAQNIALGRSLDVISASAASQNVPLTGTAGCTASMESDSLWLSLSSASVEAGGTLTYTVNPNAGGPRTGNLILTSTNCNTALGSQVITVIQAGASPVAQTITFTNPGSVPFSNGTLALTATSSSGLSVVYSSDFPAVCTVNGNAVTLVSVGTCSITASVPGNIAYSAATPVTQAFQITQGAQTVTFTPPGNQLLAAGTATLTASASSGLPISFASSTPLVCTVSGNLATLIAVGTCSITAWQNGNANYQVGAPVNQSFLVTLAQTPQTITFTSLANVPFSASPLTLSAAATSGLTVSFASTTPAVCTVAGVTATLTGPGTCSITASQAGDATYAPAPGVTQTFSVTQGTQTISFGPLSAVVYGTAAVILNASASSGLPIAYSTSTPMICGVTGNAVTPLNPGTCTITASQAGSATYSAAAPVSQSFAVNPPANSVTLTAGTGVGATGKTVEIPIQLSATGNAAPAGFQMDLNYDTTRLTFASARMGAVSAAAGKSLASSAPQSGTARLLVSGVNQNAIASGIAAYASFTLSQQFTSGTSSIGVSSCSAVDSSGNPIVTPCVAGQIRYAVCDINGDSAITVADVQLVINEALGVAPPVHDLNGDGSVNVADVQIVINAALGLGCNVP